MRITYQDFLLTAHSPCGEQLYKQVRNRGCAQPAEQRLCIYFIWPQRYLATHYVSGEARKWEKRTNVLCARALIPSHVAAALHDAAPIGLPINAPAILLKNRTAKRVSRTRPSLGSQERDESVLFLDLRVNSETWLQHGHRCHSLGTVRATDNSGDKRATSRALGQGAGPAISPVVTYGTSVRDNLELHRPVTTMEGGARDYSSTGATHECADKKKTSATCPTL